MAESREGDSAFDSAMQARTAGKDIFGDFDDEIPAIRIPVDVRMDAHRAAAKEGMTITAWARELIYGSLYGPEHVASLHANRIRRVLGNAGRGDQVALPVKGEVKAS
jgi:hypothetical protein